MVFFDAGMTLIHPVPEFHQGIHQVITEQGHDVSFEQIREAGKDAISNLIKQIMGGRRYAVSDEADREFWGDIYEGLIRDLGINSDPRALGLSIYDFYRRDVAFDLFDDSIPILEKLHGRGFRLGVISNFSTVLEPIFKHRDIRDYFDPFIVSAEENCMKPDREIFDLALERAGVGAHEAVMIGDNPMDDVDGSAKAGIASILIDRFDRVKNPPEATVKSLLEIDDILENNSK